MGTRQRILAALGAVVITLVGLGMTGGGAQALSNPASPWLTLDRTIGSQPWAGAGTSAFDIEGIAYLPWDDQVVVADDSADRVYFVNRTTGALVRTIPQSAFAGALPYGAASPTAGVNRADAFRAVVYDVSADTLYVFSGNCCGATGPYEPAAFRLKRDGSGVFQVESYQPLPEGTDAVAGAILPGHGIYIGRGTRLRHYSYQSNLIAAPIQLTGTGTNVLGMAFPDANTMIVTNSDNRVIKVRTSDWTAVNGWSLDAGTLGVQQARSLAINGDEFIIADGSDTRAPADPLKYALFDAHLGEAPPIAAVFTPSVTSGPAPLGVWFVNHSVGATSFQWDFGDGTTSTDQSPAHIYATAGIYTVKLAVSGPSGAGRSSKRITAAPSNGRTGGYTLDGFGGLHAFGIGADAAAPATKDGPYWVGWDAARGVALLPNNQGGYIVDLFGGVHPFRIGNSPMPPKVTGTPYWPGQDIARGITLLSDGSGGFVVDKLGALHPFGVGSRPAPPVPTNLWTGSDRRQAQGVAAVGTTRGGYVVEGTGVVHRFAGLTQAPAVTGAPEWTWSIARDIAAFAAT